MAGGNGTKCATCEMPAEVVDLRSRLNVIQRDMCNHAIEAAEESRRTSDKVDALAAEFSRFAASVAESINKLREVCEQQPSARRWLKRWL